MTKLLRFLLPLLAVFLSNVNAYAYFEGPITCFFRDGENVTTVTGNFTLRRIGDGFAHGQGQIQFDLNRYSYGVQVFHDSRKGVAQNQINAEITYSDASIESGQGDGGSSPISAIFDNAYVGRGPDLTHSEITIGDNRTVLACRSTANSPSVPRCTGDEYACHRDGVPACCHMGHH